MKEIKLTKPQLAERAGTLVLLIEQRNQIEQDFTGIKQEFKQRLTSTTNEINRLAQTIRTGIELVDNQMTIEEAES
jgi:hypothetical protein